MKPKARLLALSLLLSAFGACTVSAQNEIGAGGYDECVARGGKILKTFPPQCVAPDGTIVRSTDSATAVPPAVEGTAAPAKQFCKDLCGDGTCQEIVCMAVGCPCAESAASCPEDCGAGAAGR